MDDVQLKFKGIDFKNIVLGQETVGKLFGKCDLPGSQRPLE